MLSPAWLELTQLVGFIFPYFIPFGTAFASAVALRLLVGSDRGSHIASVSILLGFAAAWNWLLLGSWVPYDALSRVIHIAIVGSCIGLALDCFQPRRVWHLIFVLIFALGSVWATISGALLGAAPGEVGGWVRLVVYFTIWLGFLTRLGKLGSAGPSAAVILFMLAIGLGLVGQMSGAGDVAATAYYLAASVAGYLVLAWFLSLEIGNTALLGGGGAVLGLAMALAEPGSKVSNISMLFLVLVPFADGTARSFLSLGKTTMRPALYPVVLIGVAFLPVCVAVIIAFVLKGV